MKNREALASGKKVLISSMLASGRVVKNGEGVAKAQNRLLGKPPKTTGGVRKGNPAPPIRSAVISRITRRPESRF